MPPGSGIGTSPKAEPCHASHTEGQHVHLAERAVGVAQELRHVTDGVAVREDADAVAELEDGVVIRDEVHVAAPHARHDSTEAPRKVEVP